MRVLFLALDINIGSRTGDATHVKELAISLTKLDHEVVLTVPATEEAYQESRQLNKHENLTVYLNKNQKFLNTLSFCRKIVKEHKPDIIYERRFSAKAGSTLSTLSSIPLVVEINGLVEEEAKSMGTLKKEPPIIYSAKKRMRKGFFAKAKEIVAASEGIKRGLNEEYDVPLNKIHVIHNGANTELFKPMDQRKCKKELGLDPDKRYVCFVGKLTPWQGIEYLIDAGPLIIDRIPGTVFLIIGDGPLRAELENRAKKSRVWDRIKFTGAVKYEDVPIYVNASDVCIAPFSGIERNIKYGSLGIKLFEYMACGTPFVTTDVCGIEEEIESKKIGIVVKHDDPESLADAVSILLEDSGSLREMGKRGRKNALENHSWLMTAQNVAGICENVMKMQ